MISPPFRSPLMPFCLLSFMHGAEGHAALFTISKTSSGNLCISDEITNRQKDCIILAYYFGFALKIVFVCFLGIQICVVWVF